MRPAQTDMASDLYQLLTAQRAHLVEWVPWLGGLRSQEDCLHFLQEAYLFNEGGQKLFYFLYHRQQLIGSAALMRIDHLNRQAEMGYWIARQSQGQGIITRSCQQLIRYAFGNLNINRMEVRTSIDNIRAQYIPFRLGFEYEGVIRQGLLQSGRFRDIALYSLLRQDWALNGYRKVR